MQWKALWHSLRRGNQNGNNPAYLDPNSNSMLKTSFFPKKQFICKNYKDEFSAASTLIVDFRQNEGSALGLEWALALKISIINQWGQSRHRPPRKH